ncbi:MAG: glutamate--tRNA ligase [Phycisphaerales bacterium]|nr:glutamate--tRNA ligase [Phycisphaerales bacterium]
MSSQAPVVTRFAPSPTGHLHIGGARSALFCWAFAKAQPDGGGGGGGRFMVRIEDTDQARSSEESARGILEDLAWLGIEWDDGPMLEVSRLSEPGSASTSGDRPAVRVIGANARPVGPYFQAQRVPIYARFLNQLVDSGRAYPAFETNEELEAKRKAAVAAKQTYRYDRAAYQQFPTPAARRDRMKQADTHGEPYVIRFHAPSEEIVVRDQVLGDVRIAAGELDDFVIRKADGFPTYHFAVVVDDETMGVTHVMRAQEHLYNTPRHVALQKALGFRTPVYAHMPLIFNPDGSKMSKRDKAKAARKAVKDAMGKDPAITPRSLAMSVGADAKNLADFIAGENDSLDIAATLARHFNIPLPEVEIYDFRNSGYLPEAIVNFIALLGWNPGMKQSDGKDLEKFDLAFLARHFSIERIGRSNAKFDRAKLLSFNGDYLQQLSDDEFTRRFIAWCRDSQPATAAALERQFAANLPALIRMAKPRAKVLRDVLKVIEFALVPDDQLAFDSAAVQKSLRANNDEGLGILKRFAPVLESVEPFTPDALHTAMETFAARELPADPAGKSNLGKLAQPLRVAITGSGVSPPVHDSLACLGRARAIVRLHRCLEAAQAR